jgi:predicted small lipoprotein YifL
MKSEPLTLLLAAVLLALGGCGQTGALYLPGEPAEQPAEIPQITGDTPDDADGDDNEPAETDNTP